VKMTRLRLGCLSPGWASVENLSDRLIIGVCERAKGHITGVMSMFFSWVKAPGPACLPRISVYPLGGVVGAELFLHHGQTNAVFSYNTTP
jgi:hypothetical protein